MLLVVTSVLAAVVASILAIRGLERSAVAARDGETALLQLRLDLLQMRDLPWDAAPGSGVSPAAAKGELRAALATFSRRLGELGQGDLPDGARIRLDAERESAALWSLSGAVRHGRSAAARRASDAAARRSYAADAAMDAGAAAYRIRASHALRRAQLGAALVVALLFALFAWFYAGAVRVRRERERLLTEAHRVAEDERLSLAGELHDGPIQKLTALAMRLDLAELRGEAADLPGVLAETRTGIGEQVDDLRRLMVDLRPPALDAVGLVGALEDHLGLFERRTGIHAGLEASLDRPLGDELETILYRVVQEALTNAWKHAGATQVRVVLREDGRRVVLTVEDDGSGFVERPSAEIVAGGHIGLALMRERVERMGGRWRLSSTLGLGTVVEAVVPV